MRPSSSCATKAHVRKIHSKKLVYDSSNSQIRFPHNNIGGKLSFHLLSEGIKKKRQVKLKKNKAGIFVVGKSISNDDEFQSKCDSSFSVCSDEAKKEIGKKLVNVYGPQGSRHKYELYRELLNIMSSIDVWILFGDLNVVRSQDERLGTLFVEREARAFNEFIANGGLHELPMRGHCFTHFNREGSKLSKLDRFLDSNHFFDIWRDAKVKAMVRGVSDHCPIMLLDEYVNFGPKSFKIVNHWKENDSFSKVVENSWKGGVYSGSANIVLKTQIKKLKSDIKHLWHVKYAEDGYFMSHLNRPKFCRQLFKRLDQNVATFLEAEFTMDEVKAALILIFCPKVEMSRDILVVGSTMRISLLYQREYSQWVERFMNYLEEQTDGEAMINLIKNGDQPLPRVTQVSIARTTSTEQPPLKDKSVWSDQEKRVQKIDHLWDALARHMLGLEYDEQDRKAVVLYEYETFKATKGELLPDTYIRYLQVINDLKKCGYSKDNYVNDAIGSKKKTVVVTSDPLALIAEKTNVSRSKQKVVVSLDSEGGEADDFSELKKITALLAKAFNRRKFYFKPTNNNLRTSSSSQFTNKKQEFVKTDTKKVEKKDDEKKRDMSRVKCYNCKKEGHFAKDCKKAKEINANMVFMAHFEKVLSDSEASSSSADEKISE
nr:cytochrome P450 [Tanacetum cinerariifolium]